MDDTAFIVEKRGEPRLGHAASDPLSLVGGDRIGGRVAIYARG